MRYAMLSCAFASAMLSHTVLLGQNAVAGSNEAGQTKGVQAQPRLRLAQNTGAVSKTGTTTGGEQKLPAGAIADGHGQISALAAAARAEKGKEAPIPAVDEETLSLYPTAAQCGQCHKQIYEEWASSNHAYASISPMFHAFEQKFQELTKGTVGTFCVRCHQQVGTQLGESREKPLWQMSQISREGVSCITCHRVKEQFGKVNGERRVEPGNIFDPVYGSGEKSVIKDIIANKDTYSVKTSKDGRGTDIHNGMRTNPQITKSEFCVSCHQVAVNLGIKLEIVWDQYRDSPARSAGVTCQDCHMGKVPGKPEGYATAPSAVIGGKEINPGRRHANHRFIGPGYSIAHPGIFPHNTKAQAFTMKEWLQFDWRAGWGTNEFEDKVARGKIKVDFPKRWADPLDREDARQIIDENLAQLDKRDEFRRQIMENGTKVDGPYIEGDPKVGRDLAFSYRIKNLNSGHNLPSGSLGAQPQLWVNDLPRRSRRPEHLGVGLRRQQRRHGRSAQPGGRGRQNQSGPTAGEFPDQVPDHERQGYGPRDVPAGQLRHRPAAASAAAADPDLRSQPSAAGAHGEPLAAATG
jgi:nitrate/TMAO reductase-like tetraheme cytochrome c subunit